MNALSILGAAIGLAVAASAVWLAYNVHLRHREQGLRTSPISQAAPYLFKWTFFDYMLLLLGIVGGLLLFADVLGVLRDAGQYPPYHFQYLLFGFVCLLGANLMLLIRLMLTLRAVQGGVSVPDEQNHPHHAEHAE